MPFQPFQTVKCLESLRKVLSEQLFFWKGVKEMCSGTLDVDVKGINADVDAPFLPDVDVDVRLIDKWT